MKDAIKYLIKGKTELAGLIDHTLLKPEATLSEVLELCRQAKHFGFANVCVNPCFVKDAFRELTGSGVGVCTVVGFPLGTSETLIKAAEAAAAIRAGASEIDVVINVGYLKGNMMAEFRRDLDVVVEAVKSEKPKTVVKFILETCLLTDDEKLKACETAVVVGADCVKTSTGFGKGGASVHDVRLLRKAVGPGIGVKASGGIRNLSDVLAMVAAGASRIGTSSGVSIINDYQSIQNPAF